jgi:hypothetical protein
MKNTRNGKLQGKVSEIFVFLTDIREITILNTRILVVCPNTGTVIQVDHRRFI